MISRGAVASVLGAAGTAGALLGIFAAETHGPATGDIPFAPLTQVTTEPAPLPTDRPTSGSAAKAGSASDPFTPLTERMIIVVTTSDPVPLINPDPGIEPPITSDPPTDASGLPDPRMYRGDPPGRLGPPLPPDSSPPPLTTDPVPTG